MSFGMTVRSTKLMMIKDSSAVCVAIVYHTGYGHTARQAEAVRQGVEEVNGVTSLLMSVEEAENHWEALAAAQAIVFGTPTYMGGPAARFKAFQDATCRAIMPKGYRWRNKLAAGFTSAAARAGDTLATLIQLGLYDAPAGVPWVNLDLPPANNPRCGSENDLNRLGSWLRAAAPSNVDEAPDIAPPAS